VLYGLFQGRNEIRRKESVILTEGYADVMSLHQAGYKNAVASSGTSLTIEQLKILHKYTKKIYIVYDADSAGIAAAIRAIDLAIAEGFDILLISLPAGEDPDSIVRKMGNQVFQEYINDAENFVDFRIRHLRNEKKLSSPAEISNAIREIIRTIIKIPDRLQHDDYISRLASLLRLSSRQVERIYQEKVKIEKGEKQAPRERIVVQATTANTVNNSNDDKSIFTPDYSQILIEEQLIFKYLVSNKEVADFLMDNYALIPDNLYSDEGKRLLELIMHLYTKNNDIIKHIVENEEVHPMDKDYLVSLAIEDAEISTEWKAYSKGSKVESFDSHRPVRDALTGIEKIKIEEELNRLQEIIKNDEDPHSLEILKKYNELSKRFQIVKSLLSNETAN
jgi:DNA primase